MFFDEKNNKYIKIEDDGNEVDVIKISNQKIIIQLSYLKRYLAIKDSSLVFYFDVYRRSMKNLKDLRIMEKTERVKKDNLIYLLDIANNGIYGIPFNPSMNSSSRLLGKKIVEGLKNYKPNYLDFEDKKYLEFIIGIDENGEELVASCNNYNLEPNQYLNPVFFEKDVLSKYFNNPEKYSVLDSFLKCKSLWGLPIDNNHKDYIIVFLGDLGRSLSYREQQYWRHYNIIPEGGLSSTYFRRSFSTEFAPPERSDLVFKMKFEHFRLLWEKKFGWVLFKPLRKEDYHYYKTLRIPLINSIVEFEAQVLSLTKIMIDSLNEKELKKYLTLTKEKDVKGITKLKEFLKSMKITDFEEYIEFLRDLQKLRSMGAAHRKSNGYIKIAEKFNIGTDEFPKIFDIILSKAIALIDFLTAKLL